MKHGAWLLATGMVFSSSSFAEDGETNEKLSLASIFDLSVSLSLTSESRRETPSIVSVVTSDDIKKNGARDLVDVLNMIPGFNISKDVDQTAYHVRGIYGFEGRVLFLLDGMQLNDLNFGSYFIGNDIPVHLVDRIEVIRGPGSAVYGGTAELAVINIIPKKNLTETFNKFSARMGRLKDINGRPSYGHQDIGFIHGGQSGNLQYSVLAYDSHGVRTLRNNYLQAKEGDDPVVPELTEENADSAFQFDGLQGKRSFSALRIDFLRIECDTLILRNYNALT
ncbi:MAG: TonB-dependent receptor plug domain-containing protein [Pseudobacteriovorax sp.]|nr:TonB-dependent receptor plug domain-containing protein [Pseudobacteriovorax sp.]